MSNLRLWKTQIITVKGDTNNWAIAGDTNNKIVLALFFSHCFPLGMSRKRSIVPWKNSETKAAIYHCIARVVDKRFAFSPEDKEQFRIYMRMMENFSGCRVLAYCVM
ncbi:MAG: hypothetical protein ACRDBP_16845, partial [Luteolibacter sp.]